MTKASKNTEKILSVSVAAYNLGDMIRENLDSFVKAPKKVLDKIEILVTNDGSTDDTPKIVKEYAKKYPKSIILINQKNQGAGSTVNSGIKHATGKYFKMIDGDDWVESINLESIISKLEKTDADIVLTDMLTYNESVKRITDRSGYNLKEDTDLKFTDVCNSIDIQMHNAMYKTELLKKNKVKLDNGFYTDIEYVLLPLPFVKKIAYFAEPLYVYRIARSGQSMSKASMRKNAKQHSLVLKRLIDEYDKVRKNLAPETDKYLTTAIGRVANTELRVKLLIEEPKEAKKENIKDFFAWVESYGGKEIYKCFLKGRKARILKLTNFKAISYLERLVEKKFY
ncbi:glycosyltransferase family 2 protein [Candidatus Saccharibacteria bacterium]|nr:glycosyltransferase family 2 protein [Candidatus Saccharibacteria bacterium]